jgi:nucleoside-diphosphate-sugar epimerase
VAAAIALAVTNSEAVGRVYNVAEPTAYMEGEWVARIGAIVGWAGAVVAVAGEKMPVPFDTAQDLCVDTTRIRVELGYREVVGRDDALRETLAWERDNLPELPVDYAREDRLLADLRR